MFNNKWIVITLAAAAAYMLFDRVVLTILDEFKDAPIAYNEDEDPDQYLVDTNESGSGIETAEQGFKFSSAQRDLQRISVSDISWNTSPARDPFAPRSSLDANAIESVQAELIELKSPQNVRAPIRRQKWPEISAVVSSANHRYAVIDGEIRRIGEKFGRYKLVAVETGGVRLMDLTTFKSQEVMVTP